MLWDAQIGCPYTDERRIIPSNCDPRYDVSFIGNLTGFPLKYCGNDGAGMAAEECQMWGAWTTS